MANESMFGVLGQATELRQRILFTLGALIVYRLGTYIPVPGINSLALSEIVNNTSSGAVSVLDPGTGYFQIAGTDAFIVPAGTGSQRHTSPVLGMTRWNTTDGRLEIYDGSAWDTVAGSSGAVSQTDAQNIALELVLSLG